LRGFGVVLKGIDLDFGVVEFDFDFVAVGCIVSTLRMGTMSQKSS